VSGGQPSLAVEPCDHIVNCYDNDDDVIRDVARFVASGLRASQRAVVVATPVHRHAILAALRDHGINGGAAQRSGDVVFLDAAETLAAFMTDSGPDRGRFMQVVGDVIERAGRGGRGVRAFGEMVALLWKAGDVAGAIELESLWNDLARHFQFSLYCAYPLSLLEANGDLDAINQVCRHHSGVLAPLSYRRRSATATASDVRAAPERDELFLPVPEAVGAVRRFVRDALAGWDEPELVDDASLVASELATNAVRHADSAFRFAISRGDAVVRVEVHDVSPALPVRRDRDLENFGGRGVAMVERLSVRWGTEQRAGGKVVWAELLRPNSRQ
jgi:anti-sigma regulatory factor (Ser/Thr protein kinase)